MPTIVLLVEQELSEADIAELKALRAGEPAAHWHVVVPQGLPPVALAATMPGAPLGDGLALGMPGTIPPMPPDHTEEEAQEALATSVERMLQAGLEANGEVVDYDPVEPLADVCRREHADEVVCLTRHHRISELLHRDWAARAREVVGVPVVRLYSHQD